MSILLVVLAALMGSIVGALTARRKAARKGVAAALVVVAMVAAVGTNSNQALLDQGLDFTTVDVIEAASAFVFGYAVTAAWVLLAVSRMRWLLLALVPVALFEPLRLAVRLIAWAIRRLLS